MLQIVIAHHTFTIFSLILCEDLLSECYLWHELSVHSVEKKILAHLTSVVLVARTCCSQLAEHEEFTKVKNIAKIEVGRY
jgi:hypothetical protein